jgi:hypothetical protein
MMKLLFLCMGMLCYQGIWGQEPELIEAEEKQSTWNYYLQNPIDINHVKESELENLQILSPKQIKAFLEHRSHIGLFESIYELQTIPHWDMALLRQIQVFLVCQQPSKKWYHPDQSRQQVLLRWEQSLEQKKGFSPPDARSKTRYEGEAWSQFLRYRGQFNSHIRVGLLFQKDSGEVSWADFTSFFIEIKARKYIDKVIIGDFINQWGQGLIQAGGFSLGKSYESIKSTQKFHLGAIPYSSSGENGFYRGASLMFHIGSLQGQSFFSYRKLDAYVRGDSAFTSFITDGYHRTLTEISHQENVHEFTKGVHLQWNWPKSNTQLYANHTFSGYNLPKAPSALAYKQQEWHGNTVITYSMGIQIPIRSIRWMAEVASNGLKGLSFIQGAATALNKQIDFSYVLRMYSPAFYSPMAQAFSENSTTGNEMGLFIGNQIAFSKRSKLSSYIDFFAFPGQKFQVSERNTWGWEFVSRHQYEKKSRWRFFGQLKWTSKQEDGPRERPTLTRQHNIQTNLDIHRFWGPTIDWHSRLMMSLDGNRWQKDTGFLFIQDMSLKINHWKLQTRLGLFNTSSYNARLYAYEPSLPSGFSLPAYAGHGLRSAIVGAYELHKNIQLALKIGRTDYWDRNEIGSGLDVIAGTHKTDVSVQCIGNW